MKPHRKKSDWGKAPSRSTLWRIKNGKVKNPYSVSRTTAYRIKKGKSPGKGSAYHKKEVCINTKYLENLDYNVIKAFVIKIWQRSHFANEYYDHIDDFFQEALLRIVELSGKDGINNPAYLYTVCKHAVYGYFNTFVKGECEYH